MKKKLKTSNFEKIFLGGNILWKLNEMNFSNLKIMPSKIFCKIWILSSVNLWRSLKSCFPSVKMLFFLWNISLIKFFQCHDLIPQWNSFRKIRMRRKTTRRNYLFPQEWKKMRLRPRDGFSSWEGRIKNKTNWFTFCTYIENGK